MMYKILSSVLILFAAIFALIGGATEADLLAITATVIGGSVAIFKFIKK